MCKGARNRHKEKVIHGHQKEVGYYPIGLAIAGNHNIIMVGPPGMVLKTYIMGEAA